MLALGLGLGLLVLLLGVLMLRRHRDLLADAGLPEGQVVYTDTADWRPPPAPLLSRRYGLVGRPDYLVAVSEAGGEWIIPVEVKSRTRPDTPYDSHILQLAAYCLLVEDHHRRRPPFGLLHYADATLRIPFTDDLRRRVLLATQEIRAARGATDQPRQHQDAGRCVACGYRHACEEAVDGPHSP